MRERIEQELRELERLAHVAAAQPPGAPPDVAELDALFRELLHAHA